MTISGGQRQRLALARAFYKDAPVLILDEATSALDSQTEAAVRRAVDRLCAGRTAIIIAHRLATIERAQKIAVVDGGKIAAVGDHTSLIAKSPIYAEFYRAQRLREAGEEEEE
jgi:ATP-binding cassette subfamily B protein